MGCRFQFCGDIQELLLPLHSVRGLALFISFYREFGSTYMFLLLFPSVSQLICCYYFEKILISLWVACRYLIFSSSFWPLWSILWILNGPRQDGQLFYSYLDGCSEFFCFFCFGWNLLCMFVDPTNICRSSDDGTCRIWDARYSQYSPRIYLPKPPDAITG